MITPYFSCSTRACPITSLCTLNLRAICIYRCCGCIGSTCSCGQCGPPGYLRLLGHMRQSRMPEWRRHRAPTPSFSRDFCSRPTNTAFPCQLNRQSVQVAVYFTLLSWTPWCGLCSPTLSGPLHAHSLHILYSESPFEGHAR